MTTPRTEALRDWMFDMIDEKSGEGDTRLRVDSFADAGRFTVVAPATGFVHIITSVGGKVAKGGKSGCCHLLPPTLHTLKGEGGKVANPL